MTANAFTAAMKELGRNANASSAAVRELTAALMYELIREGLYRRTMARLGYGSPER